VLAPALVVVFLAMLGITTFQTRMAQDQVELDQLQAKVVKARLLRQELEREQAELRSPVRLGREAAKMGMVPADAVGFVTVDGSTYTTVLAGADSLPIGETSAAP
jgi:cell division protein FtsL